MTHTVSIDVAAPVQLYDAFHAALVEHTGGRIDGLLAHVAWPTESGFRIIEVWTSKEARPRRPGGHPADLGGAHGRRSGTGRRPTQERVQKLDTRGLIIPSADLAV